MNEPLGHSETGTPFPYWIHFGVPVPNVPQIKKIARNVLGETTNGLEPFFAKWWRGNFMMMFRSQEDRLMVELSLPAHMTKKMRRVDPK